MAEVIDEHRQYLADTVRVASYERAIRDVVRDGDTVVDVASGTGILALLACRAGARRVYAIDAGPIVGIARQIARDNGYDDRIVFIRDAAARAEIAERADVMVTDQIGRIGFEAGLLELVADAKRRLLKPEHRIVPAAVRIIAAPVEAPEPCDAVAFWSRPVAGFSFAAMRGPASATGYPVALDDRAIVAAPCVVGALPLDGAGDHGNIRVAGAGDTMVSRDTQLHGLACWFDAQLSPSTSMTNSPLAHCRINRRQAFFPFPSPLAAAEGDTVSMAFDILPTEHIVSWRITLTPANGGTARSASGSTFHGMLLSSEDMARTDPRYVPELTSAGDGRRSILELCDGRRDLASIEQEVFRRHPELFARPSDAAAFVAEVVTRYARPS